MQTDLFHAHPSHGQIRQPGDIAEHLVKVCPESVERQVKDPQAPTQAGKHVVWEDGQSVVAEREGDEPRSDTEHGGVDVFDPVVRHVEAAEGGGDLGHS